MSGKLTCFSALIMIAVAGCSGKPGHFNARLVEVAQFDRQITGVAVAKGDRLFVNFPNWSPGNDVSVVELSYDGSTRPYPNDEWNSWRPGLDPATHFICVQSVWVDPRDSETVLWILDPASPMMSGVVAGGAKLVKVNLNTNEIQQVYRFSDEIAPRGSYLNDVRVDSNSGFAYISESGIGSLVVLNLRTGQSRRVLSDDKSTKADPAVVPTVMGRKLSNAAIHADSIALSNDQQWLYYKPLTGRTLYRISTRLLRDFSTSQQQLQAAVQKVSEMVVSDGMAFLPGGELYVTAPERNAIVSYCPGRPLTTVVSDACLLWPDSIAVGNTGQVYVTASQVHLMPRFNNGKDLRQPPFRVFRMVPGGPKMWKYPYAFSDNSWW